MTPRMRILLTCSMSGHGTSGLANFPRLPRALITISFVCPQFSVMLFCTAQSPICSISLRRVLEFAAGTGTYVSSAYLNMRFPVVHGRRSAAVTTYAAGPSPEPCITLASVSVTVDRWPAYREQCCRSVKNPLRVCA